MKYFVPTILAVWVLCGESANPCLTGDFSLQVNGYCSYDALLSSFTAWFEEPGNVAVDCTSSPEEVLALLLNVDNATAAVHSICRDAFEQYEKVPFEVSTGKDTRFVEEFFKGNSDWNEQVATLYPVFEGDDEFSSNSRETMLLKRDAKSVGDFYNDEGRRRVVDLPQLPNFEQCTMNAAYCCWPKDRQANDGNGNCASPYDYKCVDSDPADNTDLCFVDHAAGARSTGYNSSNGWFVFPFDDSNNKFEAEGPVHCHGFAWADDMNDPSFVYRGNNLFFVSLYDHMYARGYVKNIPGAPMCACAEQMPTVSRADCTQIDFANQKHNFVFTFRDSGIMAELTEVFISFNACKGINEIGEPKKNDLWSYMNRLYQDDKVSPEKLQLLTQKLVGDNNCYVAEKKHLAEHNLVPGFNNTYSSWILLGGRDALSDKNFYGKQGFAYMIDANSTDPAILRRGCAPCYFDQQWLFYKRLTPVPAELDLWWELRFGRKAVKGNIYGTDFLIYGSYDDAKNNKNAWSCPNYSYYDGFPGNCGPNGTIRTSQGSIFDDSNSKNDVAWFAEGRGKILHALSEDEGDIGSMQRSSDGPMSRLVSKLIGINNIPGQAYTENGGNNLIVSASGLDIWGNSDHFRYTYESAGNDVTVSVRLTSMDYREPWTKAGLMIRDSLEPGAKHFSIFLTGNYDPRIFWREQTNGSSDVRGSGDSKLDSIWLKITKRGNSFKGYKSVDGKKWEIVDGERKVMMGSQNVKVGIAVTSHHPNRLTETTFRDYENLNYQYPSSAPSSTPSPSYGHEGIDIGLYDKNYPSRINVQGGKTIVKASGADIWWREDGFTFVNFQLEGDFSMTTRVKSVVAPNSWTKMGLMIRQSLAKDAKHVFVFLAPNQGIMTHIRRTTGDVTDNQSLLSRSITSWTWLRLEKKGNVVTGYASSVGGSNEEDWLIVYKYTISFEGTMEVGLAVTSHEWRKYATAEFEQFNIDRLPNQRSLRRAYAEKS